MAENSKLIAVFSLSCYVGGWAVWLRLVCCYLWWCAQAACARLLGALPTLATSLQLHDAEMWSIWSTHSLCESNFPARIASVVTPFQVFLPSPPPAQVGTYSRSLSLVLLGAFPEAIQDAAHCSVALARTLGSSCHRPPFFRAQFACVLVGVQCVLLVQALRPDRVLAAMHRFVHEALKVRSIGL